MTLQVGKLPAYQRRGFQSRAEERQYKRFERGTRSDKQRSNAGDYADSSSRFEQAVYIGDQAAEAVNPIYERLDRLAGSEGKYDHDGKELHRYTVGTSLCTKLHGQAVKVLERWNVFDRLRYRIQFVDGQTIALTQAQLISVLDAPERCVEVEKMQAQPPMGRGTIRCHSGAYNWYVEWCESKATS